MGSYHDYLASGAWRELRSIARQRAGHRCECCGGSAEHVHHVRYPKHGHWRDDSIDNLLVLCASCHAKQHGIRRELMKEIKAIEIDGYRLCCTLHEGRTVVRWEDAMLAFGYRPEHIHGRRWDACAAQMIEGTHFFILENPFTRQQEPFLNHAGIGITATGHCRDAGIKNRIMQAMANAWQREIDGKPSPDEALTPAELILRQAAELVRLDREQRAIAKRQDIADAIHHELDERQQKMNRRLVVIEREKEERREAIEEAIQADRFTTRQRLLMHRINPEMNYHGEPVKLPVGRLAAKLGREKRVVPEKIMEGTHEVNVWPAFILDWAIRSFGLLPPQAPH